MKSTFLVIIITGMATPANGQESSTDQSEVEVQTVIDKSPFTSARGAAMGGALSTAADDLDAAIYNPAGIGGMQWGRGHKPWLRKIYFPWFGASANANAVSLNSKFNEEGGTGNRAIGKAIVDANEGKRQYARLSAATGTVFGRTMLIPFSDYQLAAVSQGQDGLIDTRFRSLSGLGFGFSLTDAKERFHLGYFGYTVNRRDVTGTFNYNDFTDTTLRAEALKANEKKYQGLSHSAGMIWRFAPSGNPRLAIVSKDLGGTTLKDSGDAEDIKIEQDLTVGLGISPTVGKLGAFNFIFEATRLTEKNLAIQKKFRVGMELSLWGYGSYSPLAIRAGYNHAGPAFGTILKIGILGFEAASHAEDIGAGNKKVIERRNTAIFFVNVADF